VERPLERRRGGREPVPVRGAGTGGAGRAPRRVRGAGAPGGVRARPARARGAAFPTERRLVVAGRGPVPRRARRGASCSTRRCTACAPACRAPSA
jgi:hypothetical protein